MQAVKLPLSVAGPDKWRTKLEESRISKEDCS